MKISYIYDAVYPWIKGGAERREIYLRNAFHQSRIWAMSEVVIARGGNKESQMGKGNSFSFENVLSGRGEGCG